MAKERFVDNNLVKIRDRLGEGSNSDPESNDEIIRENKRERRAGDVSIHDKEWKRAIFKRWDEYKTLKRDVEFKLNETIDALPGELSASEKRTLLIKDSEEKLKNVLSELESLDDSQWDRHNMAENLSKALRKVENARMDCMLLNSKLNDDRNAPVHGNVSVSQSSVIHEITSLSFNQCFKIGLGFLFPLILGIIVASLIFSLFYYLSLHSYI